MMNLHLFHYQLNRLTSSLRSSGFVKSENTIYSVFGQQDEAVEPVPLTNQNSKRYRVTNDYRGKTCTWNQWRLGSAEKYVPGGKWRRRCNH